MRARLSGISSFSAAMLCRPITSPTLQGVSELIKRIAFLMGLIPDPLEKHVEAALEIVKDASEDGAK